MPWFLGNDQVLDVVGLSDPVSGAYLNTATVQATMKDGAGDEVAGQAWPLTLDYVPASDGNYQGVLEDGRVLVNGTIYWMELSVTVPGDLVGFWRWSDVARYRQPEDG